MRRLRVLMVAMLLGSVVTACDLTRSQECMPYEQFRLNGVIYYGPSEPISRDQLGEEVGAITKPLPDGAADCEPLTLADGQGTPVPGSKVYAVNGMDPAVALAVVEVPAGEPRLYHMRPTAP
jgi:hypothetical protein